MLSEYLKPMFCATLMEKVEEYFQDEEHQKEYKEWYEREYNEQK